MYRETTDEIKYYGGLGIDTVEMGSSSMFAVASSEMYLLGLFICYQ